MRASSPGYWWRVWRQFRRNTLAVVGLWVTIGLFMLALGADVCAGDIPYYLVYRGKTFFPLAQNYLVKMGLTSWPSELQHVDFTQLAAEQVLFPPIPYRPNRVNLRASFTPPSVSHWLGTDKLGRDVAAGLIHGARVSLSIGFVAIGAALLIGVTLGATAGYFGGWIDLVISRLFEFMLVFPTFFLLLTIAAIIKKPSIFYTMLVIGCTSWVSLARLTRSEFLRVRHLDYITAAVALGVSTPRIIIRHILPNALAPVLVSVVLGIASAILTESALSFLGVGVPADLVTWGSLLHEVRSNTSAWWLAVFPGLAIFLAVMAYNLIGEGLRDALDPRLQ